MDQAQVRDNLLDSRLSFDETTMKEVDIFLKRQISNESLAEMSIEQKQYRIFAAAAIVSELKVLPCIKEMGFTKSGITVEHVMSHLSHQLSKQEFLITLKQMCKKTTQATPSLIVKVNCVQVSFRIFKKFRKVFEQLWRITGIGKLVQNDMLSIFWLIYLLIKNKQSQPEIYQDARHQLKILFVLFKSIFQYMIANVNSTELNSRLRETFGKEYDQVVNEDFFLEYYLKIEKQINGIYLRRYTDQKSLNFKKFAKNALLIARILDDTSNFYQNEKQYFQIENYIDQISYLELRPMLAPQGFKKLCSPVDPIKNTLNFQQSEQRGNDSIGSSISSNSRSCFRTPPSSKVFMPPEINSPRLMIMTQNMSALTPIKQNNKSQVTPLTSRIANLEWITKCRDSIDNNESRQLVLKILNSSNKKISAQEYQKWAKGKIFNIVDEYSPKCLNKERRTNQIFQLFCYFIIKIYQFYSQIQSESMFSEKKVFDSILCLSTDIFNFAQHSSQIVSYVKQCQQFQIELIEALKPINWVGKNIQKPKDINTYLYSLEKRIIIKQIWEEESNVGYQLIQAQESLKGDESARIGYTDMVIWSRLNRHIMDRVEQLSKETSVQHRLIKRIQNLVTILLKQKPYLLKDNNIDQIIICCITSFLSINQIQSKQTLQKVFASYNKIQFGYHSNRQGLKGSHGQEMNLIEFYNQVFLDEVQDIVNSRKQTDFFLTPHRLNRQHLLSQNQALTPLAQKYRESSQNFAFKSRSRPQSQDGAPTFNFKNIFTGDVNFSTAENSINRSSKIIPSSTSKSCSIPMASFQSIYRKNLFKSVQNENREEEDSHSHSQRLPQYTSDDQIPESKKSNFLKEASDDDIQNGKSCQGIAEMKIQNESSNQQKDVGLYSSLRLANQSTAEKSKKIERNFSFGKYKA